jgi:glycosyltransferase involved in cell wall biosynthesis
VEKHCQQLYPRIVERGHEVILSTRSCYVREKIPQWQGVTLVHNFAPRRKSLEAIVHTFNGLMAARRHRPNILHIHAVGPSLLTPLARLLGFRVVVTNHGPDYDRQKWGKLARGALRMGEICGCRFADEVIAISEVIAENLRRKYRRESNLIYNGVEVQTVSDRHDYLGAHGITPGRYVLCVARFVPEKGLHDLIAAFRILPDRDCQLVIAGDADHETPYSRKLREMASADERIVLTGYITGEDLRQVFSHASLFVLPSYHEGLPIALLEAMSYGLPVLVSDIPAHLEVGLEQDRYFACGKVEHLKERLQALLGRKPTAADKEALRNRVREKYDWRRIADETIAVYARARAGRMEVRHPQVSAGTDRDVPGKTGDKHLRPSPE